MLTLEELQKPKAQVQHVYSTNVTIIEKTTICIALHTSDLCERLMRLLKENQKKFHLCFGTSDIWTLNMVELGNLMIS